MYWDGRTFRENLNDREGSRLLRGYNEKAFFFNLLGVVRADLITEILKGRCSLAALTDLPHGK